MMTELTRRRFFMAAGALGLGAGMAFSASQLFGGSEEPATAPVYAPDGVAIGGTDPVAYFAEARPIQGTKQHAFDWNGATWHFATAQNRDRFAAEPERYAPQYGGFCAWAVAEKGQLYSTQPSNWAIVDGKLYLNYNDDIQALWQEDVAGFIAEAERRWPEIRAKAE
jgi:YHS domain-containing protein